MLQFLPRALFVALLGLAGKKIAAAVESCQSDAHLGLRLTVAVSRRHIEVVHALFEGVADPFVAPLLIVVNALHSGLDENRGPVRLKG